MNTVRCPRCGWRFRPFSRKKAAEEAEEIGYSNAFKPWRPEEDKELAVLWKEGTEILEIAGILKRQPSAILKRLKLLGLKDE